MRDSFKEYYDLSSTLCKENNFEEALKTIDKALKINPNSYHALYSKALILKKINRIDDAIGLLSTALDCCDNSDNKERIFAIKKQLETELSSVLSNSLTNSLLNCPNCNKPMSKNARQCPHCFTLNKVSKNIHKTDLVPCRICGTPLVRSEHRYADHYTDDIIRGGSTHRRKIGRMRHEPCPNCGEPQPLKRFSDAHGTVFEVAVIVFLSLIAWFINPIMVFFYLLDI